MASIFQNKTDVTSHDNGIDKYDIDGLFNFY